MKHINKLFFIPLFLLAFVACKKDVDELDERLISSDTDIKGLLAFVANETGPNDTLNISFSDLKDTIYLVTTPKMVGDTPVDISKVTIEVEAYKSSSINPPSPVTLDLTEPKEFSITAEDGTIRKYILKAIISEPYQVFPKFNTTVTQMWTKTGTDMGLQFPGTNKGMAVSGDYLLMLDNHIDKSAMAAIRLYEKSTGAFVKNISFYEGGWTDPRSYSWNLQTDDQGALVMGRLNSGGAGFMLDFWPTLDAVPTLKLNSVAGADLPANTGKRMSVVGNLNQGQAFVYATAAHFYGAAKQEAQYAVYEFNDGVPVSTRPTVFTYPGAGTGWYNATVQRASVTDNTLYISWVNEDGYPNDHFETWDQLHKINFHIFKPGGTTPAQVVAPENFGYRMLDTRVFSLLDGTFMAMLEQSYSTIGAMKLNVFNLSDPTIYSLKPGDTGHEKLRIFSSPQSPATSNDGRYGHVAVDAISSTEAMIYVYFPNPDAGVASVTAYKLQVEKIN